MKSACKTGSVEDILREVEAEFSDCSFVMFCADDKRFEEFTKGIHKVLPAAKSIGGTGIMIGAQGGMEAGLTIMGFTDEDAEVYVGTIRKTDSCPIKYVPGFLWAVEEINNKYKNNVCVEFCTGHEERVVSTMKISLERVGMRLVGGTSGNTTEGQAKKVSCNGKVLNDTVAFAVIGSKMGRIEIIKENLYEAAGRGHVVTRVSEDQRTIYEIDGGRKPVDVYKEELGYTDANIEQGVFEKPLCRTVGTEHYITAIFSFNPDGSITTYKNLQKNDLISFTTMRAEWKNYMGENMRDHIGTSKVAGIFTVNCILRYLLFEREHHTKDYGKMLEEVSGGVYLNQVSDGEQYIEQHVNQSMVGVIFFKD